MAEDLPRDPDQPDPASRDPDGPDRKDADSTPTLGPDGQASDFEGDERGRGEEANGRPDVPATGGSRDHAIVESPPAGLTASRKKLGPYEILGELGRGGMGVVYKAFLCVSLASIVLSIISSTNTPMANAGEPLSSSEWNKLYEVLKKDLYDPYSQPHDRANILNKMVEAGCREAAEALLEFREKTSQRLSPLLQVRMDTMRKIDKLMNLHDNQKGLIPAEQMEVDQLKRHLCQVNSAIIGEKQVGDLAIAYLGRFIDKNAVVWIINQAKSHPLLEIKCGIVSALEKIKDNSAERALLDTLRADRLQLRLAALDAIGGRNFPGFDGAWKIAMGDESWQVRHAALCVFSLNKGRWKPEVLDEFMRKETGRMELELRRAYRAAGGIIEDGRKEPNCLLGITLASKNLIFLFDESASMGEAMALPKGMNLGNRDQNNPLGTGPENQTRIEVGKWLLKKAINDLAEDARFNVIFFARKVSLFSPSMMVEASPGKKKQAMAYINERKPVFGGTCTWEAINMAFDLPSPGDETKNAKCGPDTFILISDGVPTAGEYPAANDVLNVVQRRNKYRRVAISALCMDPRGSGASSFLRKLTENWGDFALVEGR